TRTRKSRCLAAGNVRDSLQPWPGLSSRRRIHESRAGAESGLETETRFTRDTLSAGASLCGRDKGRRCPGSARSRAQAGSAEYGHHLSSSTREHVAELFRGCDPASGIRLENSAAARRPPRRIGGELLHVRQGGKGHRRIQDTDSTGSVAAILRIHGTLVSPPGALR